MPPLNILVIEDSSADFRLIVLYLQQRGLAANCQRVASYRELQTALEQNGWDIIRSDYNVPGMEFRETLSFLRKHRPDLPVILVSGSVGEEHAVELLKLGAWDFVLKERPARLALAIERSLREAADCAARRDAETALQENASLLRKVIDLVPHNIFAKDRDGRYLFVNQAAAGGQRPEDLVGHLEREFWPDASEAEKFHRDDCEIIDSGQPKFIPEEPGTGADGRVHILQTTKVPFTRPGSTQRAVMGVAVDITERKLQEREIERLTRLYATHSQINQAIVRVKSCEELTAAVTRVAIEFGGFKLAWVGRYDPQTREVTPLGSAGESLGFVYHSCYCTDDTARDHCLCNAAIREDHSCVANDLSAAPEMPEWRAAMDQAGIRAAAVFPIRVRGTLWGLFGVYAAEPDVFQDREISLLEEASLDIGYALEYIDNERQRQQAEEATRQSETEFRAMFDVACIGMAQTDPSTGQWLRVNRKMCEITGYSADELLGMRVPEITHPEDRQYDWDLFQRVVPGEARDYRVEKRYVRRDGSIIWVNVIMTVIRDAAGQPFRTLATTIPMWRHAASPRSLSDWRITSACATSSSPWR